MITTAKDFDLDFDTRLSLESQLLDFGSLNDMNNIFFQIKNEGEYTGKTENINFEGIAFLLAEFQEYLVKKYENERAEIEEKKGGKNVQ